MKLTLTVLGSRGFSPEPGRRPGDVGNPAGYAARAGREVLLFDLGFGNLRQLLRAGIDPAAVTHAFFTHRHPDHVGDLPALLFHYNYARRPARGRLRLYGPRGFAAFLKRLTHAHHPWLRPRGFTLQVAELEEGGLVAGRGWRVRVREVPHSTEALAFRLETKTSALCYSGDTGFDPGLARFAAGADLFVIECSLPDGKRHASHLRVSQALELLQASGAKRGLFTHLSRASSAQLARRLPANARMAKDLLRLSVG